MKLETLDSRKLTILLTSFDFSFLSKINIISIVIYIIILYVIPICRLHIYLEMFTSLDSNSIKYMPIIFISYVNIQSMEISVIQPNLETNYLYCIFFPYHYNQHFLPIEYLLQSVSYVRSLIVYCFIKYPYTTFINKIVIKTYLSQPNDHRLYILKKVQVKYRNRLY